MGTERRGMEQVQGFLPQEGATNLLWVATQLQRCTDAAAECPHKHLPIDPRPHSCDCWGVYVSDKLLQDLTEAVKAQTQMLKDIIDMVNRVDTNVKAASYQIKEAGDNGR